ncbi:MAG: hypothetical protein KIT16_04375 [Rhodospirillaceae bacterium]|nr:hypothetical protein [Rhodospirillaceae bacterium]
MFESQIPRSKSHRRFDAPEDILVDRALENEERRRLLEDWRLELELLATATAENMPDTVSPGMRAQPEELLRRVNACRRMLGDAD